MPLNVLVTAASRRVPLIRAFRQAISAMNTGGAVVVADVNALSPAVYCADRAWRVSFASDPGYIDELLHICERESIGLLVPTIDDELPLVGGARDRFARIGTRVAASDRRVAEICNDKFETSRYLIGHGIAAARSYLPSALPQDLQLPLFIKPRHGRGGVGAFAATNRRELEFFLTYVADAVVQEHLSGPEYTIDMLCDFGGRPLSVVPRERVVIRAGVSDRGRTVHHQALVDIALACAHAFTFVGAVNIQCRLVGGHPVIFEINPRFSGGIPLTIAAGADFPGMLAALALGRPVPPALGAFAAGLWMTNYESSIFVTDCQIAPLISIGGAIEEVA